jgi:hypothetical protein
MEERLKKIIFLMLIFSAAVFAQSRPDSSGWTIDNDTRSCIQKIYNDPDALKELISVLLKDKETLRRVHYELMNDPEMREMMHELKHEMEQSQRDGGGMREDHWNKNKENEENKESSPDTSGVK